MDKQLVHDALVEHLTKREEAILNGTELPGISNFIGETILTVCTHLSRRWNFQGYTFLDDMIDNGTELCIRYIHNYDFRKYSNPHVFLTRYAWRGFVDVINSEEKQAYLRAKLAVSPDEISSSLCDVDGDTVEFEDAANPFFDIEEYEKKHIIRQQIIPEEVVGLEIYG